MRRVSSTLSIADEGDWQLVKKLHNEIFPNNDASLSWLKWYSSLGHIRDNSIETQTRTYVYSIDGRPVGMWCIEPMMHDTGNVIVPVGRCFATGIHPDYRGKNHFVDMSVQCIENEKLLRQHSYIIGFPREGHPVISAHIKSGWNHLCKITALEASPKNVDIDMSNMEVDVKFGPRAHSVNSAFYESYVYRQMRWQRSPKNVYTTLVFDHALAVLKFYAGVCHILLLDGPMTAASTLLKAIITLAYRHGCYAVTTWMLNEDAFKSTYEVCGFIESDKHIQHINVIYAQLQQAPKLNLQRRTIQMGIEESY